MSDFIDLAAILDLEQIEVNLFRGHSPDTERGRIFGGQVIGQALKAAYQTIDGLVCHSLHAYFIRPGDPRAPVLYQVERARDGKSFATRRVAAIQHGEQIFNLAASFQVVEGGFDHQFAPPLEAPDPDSLADDVEERIARFPAEFQDSIRRRPIEFRPVGFYPPQGGPERSGIATWMRTREDFGDDVALNQALLAYASDAGVLEISMRPHHVRFFTKGMQVASLDHAIWFHRKSRLREWHLFVHDSPSASGARGFTRGMLYTQDGTLVASVAQEGLIRFREPKEK